MEVASNFSPEMAVPMTVKMPEPMTAPMPREISEMGPSVFLRACSGSSDCAMSLSMDLVAKSWLGSVVLRRKRWVRHYGRGLLCGCACSRMLRMFQGEKQGIRSS